MGSARAPQGSPSHRETGHPAMACRAGKVRPGRAGGCGVRVASPLVPRGSAPLQPAAPTSPGSRAGRHSRPEEQQAPCCGPRAGWQGWEWEP